MLSPAAKQQHFSLLPSDHSLFVNCLIFHACLLMAWQDKQANKREYRSETWFGSQPGPTVTQHKRSALWFNPCCSMIA